MADAPFREHPRTEGSVAHRELLGGSVVRESDGDRPRKDRNPRGTHSVAVRLPWELLHPMFQWAYVAPLPME
jgi:hypothetical protein